MARHTQEQILSEWIDRLASTEGLNFEPLSSELEVLYTLRMQSPHSANSVLRLKVAPNALYRRMSRLGRAMLIENQVHAVEKAWSLAWPRRWRWGKQALLDAHTLGVLSEQDGNVQFAHPTLLYYFAASQLRQWIETASYLPDEVIAVLQLMAQSEHAARPAVRTIVSLLDHSNIQIRSGAAEAIVCIAHPVGIEALVKALRKQGGFDELTSNPVELIRLLGHLGIEAKPLLEVLIAELGPLHPHLQQPVADAMLQLGSIATPGLVNALDSTDQVEVNNVVYVLTQMGVTGIDDLLTKVHSKSSSVADSVAKILKGIGKPAVNYLITLLGDQVDSKRKAAVRALCLIADVEVIEHLAIMPRDKSVGVASTAIESLVQLGTAAVESLGRNLVDRTQDLNYRETVALILERIGKPALPWLIRAATDPDLTIRLRAIESLSEIHDDQAFNTLVQATTDTSPMVRLGAIKGLNEWIERKISQIDKVRLGVAFAVALDDPDENVRGYAAMSTGNLKQPEHFASLHNLRNDTKPFVRQQVALALGNMGNISGLEALFGFLEDPHWHVRHNAIAALKCFPSYKVIGRIYPLLEDTSPEVRSIAREVIEALQNDVELSMKNIEATNLRG